MKYLIRFAAPAVLLSLAFTNACSSSSSGSTADSGDSGTTNGGSSNGGSSNAGGSSHGGNAGTAGSTASGGHSVGGSSGAGVGGTDVGGADTGGGGGDTSANAGAGGASGGVGGTDSAGAGGTGFEEGDTLPWRPLNVTAMPGEHTHGNAGVDTRAKSLGKLVVDIGVNSGGYVSWLAKRGYHSIGAPCGACAAPNLGAGRDQVGTCRLMEFENTRSSVTQTLTNLASQFPDEDWGYFLNQDGSVRWSDVAITGMSHGATTAAIAGRLGERMWRVVSRSGPRDNTCGAAGGTCSVPLSTPSYDTNCQPEDIASWLDQPSKTPINRFYSLVGTTDVECGDIMFNTHYTMYPGEPVIWNTPDAVLTGTNQFFSTEGGHLDFLTAADKPLNTEQVLDIAFAIPPENQNPTF